MKIFDNIRDRVTRRWQVLRSYVIGWGDITCHPYGEVIYRNIVELLTDLCNDVEWVNVERRGNLRFAEFKMFFERDAQTALWRVYRRGFAVVGVKKDTDNPRFRLLDEDEYYTVSEGKNTVVEAKDKAWTTYVMKSETYREEGRSDYDLCRPFVTFLDNILNSSNTSCERMGSLVIASPETPSGSPAEITWSKDTKQELEKEMEKDYGSLRSQRHLMLLPRSMKFQTISLAGLDVKLAEKVRLCVLAICDRIKVPANQVAIIDANSGKTLANGSELREGDFNKYQSFERLLNRTFVRLADEMGMKVTYNIYNKPNRYGQQQ